MDTQEFLKDFLMGLVHSLYRIIHFIFILPFSIWKKSVSKLAEQKKHDFLKLDTINAPWPFLTYLKRYMFDFLFDALILLTYVLAPIVALILFIVYLVNEAPFLVAFSALLSTLIAAYFAPLSIAFTRDIFQLLLIPFRKFVSWGSKPAQYMDFNIAKQQHDIEMKMHSAETEQK